MSSSAVGSGYRRKRSVSISFRTRSTPVPEDMDSHLYSVSQPYAVAARPVHMVLRYVYFSKVLLLQPWYYLYLYSLASSANFGSAFTIVSYATQYAILTYPGHPKSFPERSEYCISSRYYKILFHLQPVILQRDKMLLPV